MTKIAIISDTHDNLPNTRKAAQWIEEQGIKTIIHCGDIFNPETIEEIFKVFTGKLHLIFSTADADYCKIPENSFEKFKNTVTYNNFGNIKFDDIEIAFCHFPQIAKKLALSQEYDIVFYGHTHKPWEESIKKIKMVNPGNIAGIFYKGTFAVYNTKTNQLELKILEQI